MLVVDSFGKEFPSPHWVLRLPGELAKTTTREVTPFLRLSIVQFLSRRWRAAVGSDSGSKVVFVSLAVAKGFHLLTGVLQLLLLLMVGVMAAEYLDLGCVVDIVVKVLASTVSGEFIGAARSLFCWAKCKWPISFSEPSSWCRTDFWWYARQDTSTS